jgi:hypothetical protein
VFGLFELVQRCRARYKGAYYYEEEDEPEEEPDDIIIEYYNEDL